MHFEVPADTVNQSFRRGNLARDYFHRDFPMAFNAKERLEKMQEIMEKAAEEAEDTQDEAVSAK